MVLLNVLALVIVLGVLWWMGRAGKSFAVRVFSGLILGVLLGVGMKILGGGDAEAMNKAMEWYGLVGNGYVHLLSMIAFPLVMISIISALVNLETTKGLAKKSVTIILILVATAAVAASVGFLVARGFNLRADSIIVGGAEQQRMSEMETKADTNLSLPAQILKVIPSNPFAAMAGVGDSAILSVVLFSALLAVAVLIMAQEQPEFADKFRSGVKVLYNVIIELTWLVLDLTPYGVCAIMAKTLETTDYGAIATLAKFAVASYVALAIVLVFHLLLLALARFNPLTYLRKAWPTLSFAFVSRTSAGTLPMTIRTLNDGFGLDKNLSGFAATLGTSIGQNGCAGIYPAMLAVMIAPTLGINVASPIFMAQVVATVAMTSFGVAGVGGGATFAGIMVLSALGMPVGLAGVLISIEPLIDMGRTAINVSDSMVAGLLSGRVFGEVDQSVYNDVNAGTETEAHA